MRLDQALVQEFQLKSRAQAQALIAEKKVELRGKILSKSSQQIHLEDIKELKLLDRQILKYVSRAGLKLEHALENLKLDLTGQYILDIGQSTGGFSDCCLQRGAAHVTGIDVGKDQIDENLKNNPRLQFYEKINVKQVPDEILEKEYDLVVCDLSFISLEHAMPLFQQQAQKAAKILSLVKPQFELSAKDLNKSGIVKDPKSYQTVEDKIRNLCEQYNLQIFNYFESQPRGADGNLEFFFFASTAD